MSACSVQAMSQVGCRLMVASSAKISRPDEDAFAGAVARTFATKSAISPPEDVSAGAALEVCKPGALLKPDVFLFSFMPDKCGERHGQGQWQDEKPIEGSFARFPAEA